MPPPTSTQLVLQSDADVINARLQARQMARALGFGTVDQARISLAASELARILLKSKVTQTGIEMSIGPTSEPGHQTGIRLLGVAPAAAQLDTPPNNQALLGAVQLVDEYMLENHHNTIHIILMKWLA